MIHQIIPPEGIDYLKRKRAANAKVVDELTAFKSMAGEHTKTVKELIQDAKSQIKVITAVLDYEEKDKREKLDPYFIKAFEKEHLSACVPEVWEFYK